VPCGVPVKEKAAFSEQPDNKYEDQKGNKKVGKGPKNMKMTRGQKCFK
jgi:hypothetical protein